MATGVVSWSQTAATNATADTNVNMAEGMAPSQLNDSVRALMASVAKWRDDMAGTLLSSGSNTAFTVASNQVFPSLAALSGQTLAVRFAVTSGATPTLSVDGLGAKPITTDSTNAVAQGAIRANAIHHVTYDNSIPAFIVHNGHALIEPGRIAPHGQTAAPAGWLLCDGSPYSRTTYADLFANISTTFGSSDGSSFKVPDLRGKAGVGMDPSGIGPLGAVTIGSTTGSTGHTLVAGDIPAHTHSITDPGHVHAYNYSGGAGGTSGVVVRGATSGGSDNTASANTGITATNASTGAGAALTAVQPSLIVNYVIKT